MASILYEEAALTAGDNDGGMPSKSETNLFPIWVVIALALVALAVLSARRIRKGNN